MTHSQIFSKNSKRLSKSSSFNCCINVWGIKIHRMLGQYITAAVTKYLINNKGLILMWPNHWFTHPCLPKLNCWFKKVFPVDRLIWVESEILPLLPFLKYSLIIETIPQWNKAFGGEHVTEEKWAEKIEYEILSEIEWK